MIRGIWREGCIMRGMWRVLCDGRYYRMLCNEKCVESVV